MENKISELEYHDIANGYPMATPNEFALLKVSISERGQQTPIVIFDGKILDGRNRYRACIELGIEPVSEVFTGDDNDALSYSHELNSGRRNLDKSQKAMVAAYEIERTRHEGISNLTIKQASQIYAVSDNYIKRALKIIHHDLSIAEQVFIGAEQIGRAEKRIEEIHGKEKEIEFIMNDVSKDSSSNIDDELAHLYKHLYGMDKSSLVSIIVRKEYVKKGN